MGSESMSLDLPRLFLGRHGDTAWTESGQHTGLTDLPLNHRGEEHARRLGEYLRQFNFSHVFTSPLQRAAKTCQLAGFGAVAEVDRDLVEWNYGRFEGKTSQEIHAMQPGWEIFRDGGPEGETPEAVAARADHFISKARTVEGNVLAFSSGHIIRMIAARWLGGPPVAGRYFYCKPASVGMLEYEHHNREEPVVGLWNYVPGVVS
jgi:probable phosphoglycerate mutase